VTEECEEKLLVDAKELAKRISVSERWIQNNFENIIGAQRVGRMRRFDLNKIMGCIAAGKNIIIK
jgi:hypothetical protein